MAQNSKTRTVDLSEVRPIYDDGSVAHVNLAPSLTLAAGTLLAQVTGSASAVMTISDSGTVSGGTFTISFTHPISGETVTTAAIAYNASNATVQAAIEKILGAGNVTVAGSGLPSNDTTLTFGGDLANLPIPVATISTTNLTGSSPVLSVALTTAGRTAGQFVAFQGTPITAPTTAPTVAGNGSGSSFAAGAYAVSYTYKTAVGETTPSYATVATVTAAQNLRVSAISSIPTGVTHVRYYVNGTLMAETAVSSGTAAQTDITGATLTVAGSPPTSNTAYYESSGTGSSTAKGILRFTVATDTRGKATYGTVSGDYTDVPRDAVEMWVGGEFDTTQLTGLTAKAVADLGRLTSGDLSNGGILSVHVGS